MKSFSFTSLLNVIGNLFRLQIKELPKNSKFWDIYPIPMLQKIFIIPKLFEETFISKMSWYLILNSDNSTDNQCSCIEIEHCTPQKIPKSKCPTWIPSCQCLFKFIQMILLPWSILINDRKMSILMHSALRLYANVTPRNSKFIFEFIIVCSGTIAKCTWLKCTV